MSTWPTSVFRSPMNLSSATASTMRSAIEICATFASSIRISPDNLEPVKIVAGIDLGGTSINYTFLTEDERFLIEDLCEYRALSREGPDVCLKQIEDGLFIAAGRVGFSASEVA